MILGLLSQNLGWAKRRGCPSEPGAPEPCLCSIEASLLSCGACGGGSSELVSSQRRTCGPMLRMSQLPFLAFIIHV